MKIKTARPRGRPKGTIKIGKNIRLSTKVIDMIRQRAFARRCTHSEIVEEALLAQLGGK